MSNDRAVVLVAEDSKFDQMVLKRAFAAGGIEAELHFVDNGEDLLAYLERTLVKLKNGETGQQPGIVLLDLHMPRMDGREAVRQIRQDDRLKMLPLVMLTTSDSESHVKELYGLGINSYVVKPNDFDVLVATVRRLNDYWFGAVRLPTTASAGPASAGQASAGQASLPGPASRRRGALLIEDTRLDYVATRGILLAGQSGITAVDWLQTWPGAEEALRTGPHEVYLVDLHLGSVSGLTIISELRAAGVLAPIIALTGTATDEIDRACTAAGASDFLVKGEFDSRALDRAIRYATRSAAVHRELDRVNAVLERRVSAEADHARLMRFAIEQSADPIFISTAGARLPDLIVVYANAALCTLLGRRSGALLGSDVGSLFGIDEGSAQASSHEAETLQRVLAEGQWHATQLPMQGPSGVFRAAVRASPLRAASGEVTHLVWTCHDLGEPQRAGDEERQREKLQAIGQLAGGVAHDFNNLLTAVLGNLELLGRQITEPRLLRLLEGASRAAERGASLAQQLMEFARAGDNEVRSLAPDALVEGMRDLLARSLGGLIQLDFEVGIRPGEESWPVLAAPESLQLAILNLTARARDAMPLGGTLRIACENVAAAAPGRAAELAPGQDYVEITIADTGGGRAPAKGSGLSQVAATVRQAGGVMLVDSVPGRGSTVRLFLPHALPAPPALRESSAPDPNAQDSALPETLRPETVPFRSAAEQ